MKEGASEAQHEGSGTRTPVVGPQVSKLPKKRTQDRSSTGKPNRPRASPSKARAQGYPPVQSNGVSGNLSTTGTNTSVARGNRSFGTGNQCCGPSTGVDEQLSHGGQMTPRSDSSPGERLFPRYGSKMPVSPRRVKSMFGPQWVAKSGGERVLSSPDTAPTSASATVAKVNQHVASVIGAAAPKGEVWHEQVPATPIDASQLAASGQAVIVGGQAQSRSTKPMLPYRTPAKLSRDIAPKSVTQGSGNTKQNKQSFKSVAGLSQKERYYSGGLGEGTTSIRHTATDNEIGLRAAGQSQSGLKSDLSHTKSSNSSSTPAITSQAIFPPGPTVLRERIISPEFSSDSDENPDTDGPHSPKIVRATAQTRSERETPRSAIPWTSQIKPQRACQWTLGTPLSDRSHHQGHTRHRKNVPMTSIEQEAAGAPQSVLQSAPLSPTVSDTFNMHFASRDEQCWLEEDRPHLGLDPEVVDWDFPFGCPRRSSNPVSEVSGVSEFSGYECRERDSDVRSRSASLGLGRFDGHAFQALSNDGWNVDAFAQRSLNGLGTKNEQKNHGDAEGSWWSQRVATAPTDLEHTISGMSLQDLGNKTEQGKANTSQRGTRELQHRQIPRDVLQSPKGQGNCGRSQTGDSPLVDDGAICYQNNRSMPLKAVHQDGRKGRAAHRRYSSWEQQVGSVMDDEVSVQGYEGRPSSAFGGRRRSIGSRILQVAVVAAAGVVAIAFGGELLKVLEDDESDDDDEQK